MSSKAGLFPADTVNSSNLESLSVLTLKIIPIVERAAEKDPDRDYLLPTWTL